MKSRNGWRRGFGMGQIMAMLLVVLPATAFFITLLFDYWSIMQIDNRLKLITYQLSGMINNAEALTSVETAREEISDSDMELLRSLCPSSMPQVTLNRTGDMPEGQTEVRAQLRYERLNHMGTKLLQSSIRSYSYHDQNGSFLFECTNQDKGDM